MTDQPPTDYPGDVWATGQRRQPGGTFPPASGAGGGGLGDGGGVEPELVDPDPEDPPYSPPHPCDDPATALDWNTDAAVAEASRRFQADANDPLLDGRERGTVLYRNPATGAIHLGVLSVGPNMGGSVAPDITGIDPSWIIGDVHSHPGSGPYPSGPDRTELFPWFEGIISAAGGNPSNFRMYMVGTRLGPDGQVRLEIRVYDRRNLNGDEQNPGPEVNPDALPCP